MRGLLPLRTDTTTYRLCCAAWSLTNSEFNHGRKCLRLSFIVTQKVPIALTNVQQIRFFIPGNKRETQNGTLTCQFEAFADLFETPIIISKTNRIPHYTYIEITEWTQESKIFSAGTDVSRLPRQQYCGSVIRVKSGSGSAYSQKSDPDPYQSQKPDSETYRINFKIRNYEGSK